MTLSKSKITLIQNKQSKQNQNTSKKILELRAEKKNAINYQDYDLAQELDKKIWDIHTNFENNMDLEYQMQYTKKLNDLISSFNQQIQNLTNEKNQKEMQLRTKINDEFEQLKKYHIKQLIEFEKQRAEEHLNESFKHSPTYELLTLRSKQYATSGNYDYAKQIQKEAENVLREEQQKRKQIIDDDFNKRALIQAEEQKKSIEMLSKKLNEGLSLLNSQYQNKEAQILSNRESAIIALYNTKGKNSVIYEAITINECIKNRIPFPSVFGTTVQSKKQVKSTQI